MVLFSKQKLTSLWSTHEVEAKYLLHPVTPLVDFLYSDQWAHMKYCQKIQLFWSWCVSH